ncbi:Oidioi.mRNA.OKI2018_I69.chr2.g5861.t1.cds [Oikopleura dioica]|uniref:Acrosin n=1 Tax=Oikopleura dioica TaxID=34765 RepID=A0ABN7T1R9_OIKDI|nr:Oidioi.mRNA.OKI2018_I69.chr2.g5861.t1.cds [Oikopleura dioica]
MKISIAALFSVISADTRLYTKYQVPPYCGVPKYEPNKELFANLPVRSQHSLIQEMTLRYEELKTQAETKIAEAPANPSWLNSEKCDPEAGNCAPQYQSMPISGKPSFGRPIPGGYSKIRRFGRSADDEHMSPNTVNNWIGKQDFEVIGEYLQRLNRLAYQNNSFDPNVQQANKSPYVNNIGTRIIGGQAAKEHSWPWQAHLNICGQWYNGKNVCQVCGATLVSPKHLVTAAHCVPEIHTSSSVMLGSNSKFEGGNIVLLRSKKRVKYVAVSHFIRHHNWNKPEPYNNDIAIVVMEDEVEFTDKVSPMCLPKESVCFSEGTPCVATGWGRIDSQTNSFPDMLQEVAVKIIDRERCKQFHGYDTVTENMICAGYENGGRDSCSGDSGGPLMIDWVKEKTGLKPTYSMEECYSESIRENKQVNQAGTDLKRPYGELNCDSPNGNGVFQTDSGVFKTANYPKNYPKNQVCSFCVKPARSGGFVQIDVNEIQLDSKKSCEKRGDYLLVEPKDKEAYYLCHVRRSKDYVHTIINSGPICLRFVSNGEVERAGLNAVYKQIDSPPSRCGGDMVQSLNLDNPEVRITSLDYPEKYLDRSRSSCAWLIKVPDHVKKQGYRVRLDFSVLQLEKNKFNEVFCDKSDTITIYASNTCERESMASAKILYELCGFYRPKYVPYLDINSASFCIFFNINGDTSKNGAGFDAKVKLIK